MKNRLSNALTKIIKLEKKGEMKQITGRLYDGNIGFCLSGALGCFFGVEKPELSKCGFVSGKAKEITYGDILYVGDCPLKGKSMKNSLFCNFRTNDIQSLIIHLNDDHLISFTEAQKIIEGLEL